MSVSTALGKLRMSREESRAMLPTVARLLLLAGLINGVIQAFTVHMVTQSAVRTALAFSLWALVSLVIAVVVLDSSDRTAEWRQSMKILAAVVVFIGFMALFSGASYFTRLLIAL